MPRLLARALGLLLGYAAMSVALRLADAIAVHAIDLDPGEDG